MGADYYLAGEGDLVGISLTPSSHGRRTEEVWFVRCGASVQSVILVMDTTKRDLWF